ncbi:GNAT family N-acetyltransferase [Paraburkholderia sp. EG285A]|uniref:GNAT family N-acetyltransferase n=1 Tax=Paraburkholderia sp. EG285A TaxID=3237009 RepID=UPI0034D20EC3
MLPLFTEVDVSNAARIQLRPIEMSDAQRIFEIWSDREVMRFYDLAPLNSIDDARLLVSAMLKELAEGLSVRWAIVSKCGMRFIGSCGFRFDSKFYSASISFELERHSWRQGLMREALNAAIAHAYDHWQINRIQAITNLDNYASIGLLKSLGFVEEGVMRQWGYWKDAFHDVHLFSRIRADQRTMQTSLPA